MKHAIFFIVILLGLVNADFANRLNPVTFAQLGDPVTLKCVFFKDDYHDHMQWYKQPLGAHPDIIVTMHTYLKSPIYYPGYNSSHFRLDIKEPIFSLTITNTSSDDEAMYYCAIGSEAIVKFRDGTFLSVKGSNQKMWNDQKILQQPVSDSIYTGKTVTVQCSVLSKICPGEHNVYWFRAGSGESHPGIIYTHGNRSDECEKNPETSFSKQSCTYSLPRNRFSSSDAGTYYCAVAICGEILFGNGTKLDTSWKPIVIKLGLALIGCGVGMLLSIICVVTRNRRTRCDHCKGPVRAPYPRRYDNSKVTRSMSQGVHEDTLNYASLHFSEKRGRRKREPPQQSVYSAVRCPDLERECLPISGCT